jgi:muconate cycloisomerase
MKIERISIYRCDRLFSLRFASSKKNRTKTEAIILRVDCENGLYGFGESTPRQYVTGESIESVSHLIQGMMANYLLGCSFSSLADVEGILTGLSRHCMQRREGPFNSALGAVDLALLDLLGKHSHRPIQDFLGPVLRDSIPYALSIPLLPLPEIRRLSSLLQSLPLASVKVLAGADNADTLNRLRFLREEFGFQGEVTLEANGIWTADDACSFLTLAGKFSIAAVEQPTAKDDIEGLKKVREISGIPVIADESMCSLSDAESLIEERACDVLNIKISKCAGLIRSREIALFAHSRGIPCQIGAHVGETEILSAAGTALARSIPEILRYDGFSSLLFTCEKDGTGGGNPTDQAPGLGVEPRENDLTELWSSGPTR